MFAVQAIWALQLLVSTALLAKVLTTYQRVVSPATMSTCEYWDKRGDGDGDEDKKYNYKCSQLTGGVVSDALLDNCSHNQELRIVLGSLGIGGA